MSNLRICPGHRYATPSHTGSSCNLADANVQAVSENVILSDSLGYQALNARAAKDTLLQRTQMLEDSQTAAKAAITKRRNVERLRGSSSINPLKVDDAIAEMEEVRAACSAQNSVR